MSDDVTTVLVIGHNPTVSDVSLLLRTDHDRVAAADVLRTAGLAVHGFAGPWSACEPGASPLLKRHTARA